MTPSEAVYVVKRVRELWPDCNWTPPVEEMFGDKIMRHNRDLTIAAITDFRANQAGRSPDVSKLLWSINERLRQPSDYGHGFKGYWQAVASRLGLRGASIEQVIVSHWKSMRDEHRGYWSDEAIWNAIVSDLMSSAGAGMDLDQAAYIADNAVGEQPEALEKFRKSRAEADAMMAGGRKEAYRKIQERLRGKR